MFSDQLNLLFIPNYLSLNYRYSCHQLEKYQLVETWYSVVKHNLTNTIISLIYIYNKNANKFHVENHNYDSNSVYHSFKQHKTYT